MAKKQSSAAKRHRQSEERRLRNKSVRSSVRTSAKKFVALVRKPERGSAERGSKERGSTERGPQVKNESAQIGETEAALRDMIKKIDTAARKGIIKKNSAARKKSRMQRLFNSIKAAQ